MDQPASIFDDQFDLDIPVRRRDLLSDVLKVFLWIIMSGAAIIGLGALMMIVCIMIWPKELSPGGDEVTALLSFAFLLFLVALGFVMTFLVWKEVKWAIKFNWVIFAISLLFAGFMVLAFEVTACLILGPVAIFVLPYWIMLFLIRRKWEQSVKL